MEEDWRAEFHSASNGGYGSGIGGLLGEQAYKQNQQAIESAKIRKANRVSRKSKSGAQLAPVGSSGFDVPDNLVWGEFPKFLRILSFAFAPVGLGAGYWAAAGFSGWWPLVGTLVGGALGLATPTILYLLALQTMILIGEIIFGLLKMLLVALKAVVALGLLVGAWYAFGYLFRYFYG